MAKYYVPSSAVDLGRLTTQWSIVCSSYIAYGWLPILITRPPPMWGCSTAQSKKEIMCGIVFFSINLSYVWVQYSIWPPCALWTPFWTSHICILSCSYTYCQRPFMTCRRSRSIIPHGQVWTLVSFFCYTTLICRDHHEDKVFCKLLHLCHGLEERFADTSAEDLEIIADLISLPRLSLNAPSNHFLIEIQKGGECISCLWHKGAEGCHFRLDNITKWCWEIEDSRFNEWTLVGYFSKELCTRYIYYFWVIAHCKLNN